MRTLTKLRVGIGIALLVISLALLAWGLWPAVREAHTLPIPPAEMSVPTPSAWILALQA